MFKRSYIFSSLVAALILVRAESVRAQAGAFGGGDIGVKLSESNVLHVGVAAEAGYDTNVYYNDNTPNTPNGRQSSAVLRVVPSILVTNNGRDGNPRSELIYSFGANLTYREYLSDKPDVRQQRAFIPSVMGSLQIPGAKANFNLTDQFTRNEEPPYVPEGRPIIRDTNNGSATLALSPGGGRLTLSLRYSNGLDYFETTDYQGASSMAHDGMVDVGWKWLPKTALFLQVGGGYIHFFNTSAPGSVVSPRDNSYPFRAVTGLRGLLTPKVTVNLGAGYATAFYQSSDNPDGAANVHFAGSVGYMPTLVSRISLALYHGFRNSPVLGNFYNVDSAGLTLNYLVGRVVLGGGVQYEYRRYQNYTITIPVPGAPAMTRLADRRDHMLSGGLSVDFYLLKWFYAGASYSVGLVDPKGDDPTAVKYTKQQVFARLGVSY